MDTQYTRRASPDARCLDTYAFSCLYVYVYMHVGPICTARAFEVSLDLGARSLFNWRRAPEARPSPCRETAKRLAQVSPQVSPQQTRAHHLLRREDLLHLRNLYLNLHNLRNLRNHPPHHPPDLPQPANRPHSPNRPHPPGLPHPSNCPAGRSLFSF